jgi:iron complex outermembrane receptor protein
VVPIERNVDRARVRYRNNYVNYGLSAGVTYHTQPNLVFGYNIGVAGRNPEVNELYSQGVHQGVGAIEEGDPNLQPEQSLKNLVNAKYSKNNKWFVDVVAYYQYIDNFIFLNPTGETRLTIRGAFPVYEYKQTNASIFGADFATTYVFNDAWSTTLKYSFLQGDNLSENVPLINMPPNNLMANVKYELPELRKLKNLSVEVSNQYVFEQKHFVEGQDFVNPPAGYYLLGATMRTERHFKTNSLTLYLRGENLLNTIYRDYLNRWRYFANETGINLVLGVEFKF